MSSDDTTFKRESPWGSNPGGGNDNNNGNGSGQRRQPPNIDDLIRKSARFSWKNISRRAIKREQTNLYWSYCFTSSLGIEWSLTEFYQMNKE